LPEAQVRIEENICWWPIIDFFDMTIKMHLGYKGVLIQANRKCT